MPWQSEAMKDVTACDKLRGGGDHPVDPEISEWGNPAQHKLGYTYIYIVEANQGK